ncbi:hypothetical protein DFH07DRAFT_980894 [Mycena maculata]|uniref:Uncharacterized protein n=1 Tax=Mycena maculata TaxID=230809 RepID=A0AAD7K400_9AGAR|nr:hypothetical protein DFH07DRAFT_980894 [Mycena maculata]
MTFYQLELKASDIRAYLPLLCREISKFNTVFSTSEFSDCVEWESFMLSARQYLEGPTRTGVESNTETDNDAYRAKQPSTLQVFLVHYYSIPPNRYFYRYKSNASRKYEQRKDPAPTDIFAGGMGLRHNAALITNQLIKIYTPRVGGRVASWGGVQGQGGGEGKGKDVRRAGGRGAACRDVGRRAGTWGGVQGRGASWSWAACRDVRRGGGREAAGRTDVQGQGREAAGTRVHRSHSVVTEGGSRGPRKGRASAGVANQSNQHQHLRTECPRNRRRARVRAGGRSVHPMHSNGGRRRRHSQPPDPATPPNPSKKAKQKTTRTQLTAPATRGAAGLVSAASAASPSPAAAASAAAFPTQTQTPAQRRAQAPPRRSPVPAPVPVPAPPPSLPPSPPSPPHPHQHLLPTKQPYYDHPAPKNRTHLPTAQAHPPPPAASSCASPAGSRTGTRT